MSPYLLPFTLSLCKDEVESWEGGGPADYIPFPGGPGLRLGGSGQERTTSSEPDAKCTLTSCQQKSLHSSFLLEKSLRGSSKNVKKLLWQEKKPFLPPEGCSKEFRSVCRSENRNPATDLPLEWAGCRGGCRRGNSRKATAGLRHVSR